MVTYNNRIYYVCNLCRDVYLPPRTPGDKAILIEDTELKEKILLKYNTRRLE